MIGPKAIAQSILGPVNWASEVHGYCHCPGRSLHTGPSGPKDCQVRLDGAPTVFCFHHSCQAVLSRTNLSLRKALCGSSGWTLTLGNGKVLAAGDHLLPSGEVLPRTAPEAQVLHAAGADPKLQTIERVSRGFLPELLRQFHWPQSRIEADSPIQVHTMEPDQMLTTWLTLWHPDDLVWIGDIRDTGQPRHAHHFRPPSHWVIGGHGISQFTCPSAFQPGTFQRSNSTVAVRRFLVVESDVLSRDEIGAVFRYIQLRLRHRLHCIIDTAGKSLHGWFDPAPTPQAQANLKAALTGFGCDPKLFTPSQPVRLPGARRNNRIQRLIWFQEHPTTQQFQCEI